MFLTNINITRWPKPNYVNPHTRGPGLLVTCYLLGPLALVVVGARLWAHFKIRKNAGIDDWLMIVSMVGMLGMMILFGHAADQDYGLERHTWDIKPPKFENQAKFTLVTAIVHTITNGTIKISVLFFYRRVGESALSRRFILTTQIALAGTVLTMLASLICLLLLCRPLDALWKRVSIENMMLAAKLQATGGADQHPEAVAAVTAMKYHCMDATLVLAGIAAVSGVLDMVAATLPVALLWRLRGLKSKQRLALCVIFVMGYLVCVTVFFRTALLWKFRSSQDPAWDMWGVWVLMLVELFVGAICASLPALRVFFREYFDDEPSAQRQREIVNDCANAMVAEAGAGVIPSVEVMAQPRFLLEDEGRLGLNWADGKNDRKRARGGFSRMLREKDEPSV